jgi:hypothetical protein
VFDRNGLPAWIAVKKVLTAPFRGLARWTLVAAGLIGPWWRTGAATAQVLVVCRCEQTDQRSGCGAEVVKGTQSIFFCRPGWLANDAGVGVGADAEGRQVTTIGCAVVGGVPALAYYVGYEASRTDVSSSPACMSSWLVLVMSAAMRASAQSSLLG